MNRIAFWVLVFFITNIADQARSADNGASALENCFKVSRLAYGICANPENPPQQRLDCFHTAQSAQLECLGHVSSDVTGSMPSAEPHGAGSSQAPANQPATAGAPVLAPAQAPSPPVATAPPEVSPVAVAPAASAASTPAGVADKTADTPAQQPKEAVPPSVATAPPAAPPIAVAPAAPAAITPPGIPNKTADARVTPSNPDWVVSETTSPIDYSPVVVATMKSSANREDSPDALSIQCRQRRPEIALHTGGAWRIGPNNKVQVAVQMKDRSPWNLSADGKTATNADHAADLIQSLSEGTTLIVTVSDGVDHAAVFKLTGLDAIRKKILAACRLTPVIDSKASMVKR